MAYLDGFVIPIPKKNIAAYQKITSQVGKVWMEYGALAYYETVGEDLTIEGVRSRSFLEPHACTKDETIVFAFILFKSKADRNRINKRVMADPLDRAGMDYSKLPFDLKRMCYGGFESIVALSAKPKKPAQAKAARAKTKAKKTKTKR
jgi:uncharacterized protein YbaA (DUF1428 family)